METEFENDNKANREQKFLDADQTDYNAVNELSFDDYMLGSYELAHQAQSACYLIFKILAQYFPSVIKKQKVKRDGKLELKYKKGPMPLEEF